MSSFYPATQFRNIIEGFFAFRFTCKTNYLDLNR
ncbi:protein of unknown function [Cyanobium sp. NIES-981]|nr:protein of unknown function [Cyanobium sp. NIES-981]